MTDEERLIQFAQSTYLMRYGRYIDDIDEPDGQEEVDKTIDWANQIIDEIEPEADWQYVRDNDREIGIVTTPTQTLVLPDSVRKLAVDEERPLAIIQDGAIVSLWDVVSPDQLTRPNAGFRDKRVTFVDNRVVFSRPFNDTEMNGSIVADVINYIPRLARDDISVLDILKPIQLLKLGVAKNATLPDIVQGGLSPSFTQKYGDLLEKAIMENNRSAAANNVVRDDYSSIGGVY